MSGPKSVWVLTDGRPGHVSQTQGLAEALVPDPVVKRIRLRFPFRQASPFLGWKLASNSAPVEPPWPDLIVTSGRSALPIALSIKRQSQGKTKIVNVQDPGYFRGRFDLIVVPEHDDLSGPNIMSTVGALGRITAARLRAEAAKFEPLLTQVPHPRVAVLIGGANGVFTTPPATIEKIGRELAELAKGGAGLMVTFSRRTGPEMESAIRRALQGTGAVIWAGGGGNPYFAFLALADHVLATEDSASMVSEAATTGKPVSVIALAGRSPKFTRFHDAMRALGATRPFTGSLDNWSYPPVDETARAAERVRQLFQ